MHKCSKRRSPFLIAEVRQVKSIDGKQDARKRPAGRSRWRPQTSGRRFLPRAFTDQLEPSAVTSTTSLMLRTIALAGVHDRKSISFRVSLSGPRHDANFDEDEAKTFERKRGILCLRAQITWPEDAAPVRAWTQRKKNERWTIDEEEEEEEEKKEEQDEKERRERRKRYILDGEPIHLAASLGT